MGHMLHTDWSIQLQSYKEETSEGIETINHWAYLPENIHIGQLNTKDSIGMVTLALRSLESKSGGQKVGHFIQPLFFLFPSMHSDH